MRQMEFAKKLAAERARAGLTQRELAEAAGLSLGSVRHLEQGLRQPTAAGLMALCGALGVSCEVFTAALLPKKRRAHK